MKVESIYQEKLADGEETLTEVVLTGVESLCILSRVIIKAIGKPGVDSDLEFLGSGDRWVIAWTYPHLPLEDVQDLLTRTLLSS
jgi:hypothetical protein